ncbi:hypothetical protein DPV78_004026 [Talaromyces pinophilus]|nr:hypothetical protein DPV78_004026 [Talaromyces pinophilus]
MATTTSRTGTTLLTTANGGIGTAIVANIVASTELSSSHHSIYTLSATRRQPHSEFRRTELAPRTRMSLCPGNYQVF